MSESYIFPPSPVYSLPIRGKTERFPIHRIFCAGRNYHAHAIEMGKPVDKSTMIPFYFLKDPSTTVFTGASIDYPPGTENYHYEMELVLYINKVGFNIPEEKAHEYIYGYSCGLDMTRRDIQLRNRDLGRPWDLSKNFEEAAIFSEVVPMEHHVIEDAKISLSVNGEVKQDSNVSKLIWNIREIIADLSKFYHFQPGDVIFTGTPEGVGPVVGGDKITGMVEGVGVIALNINPKK